MFPKKTDQKDCNDKARSFSIVIKGKFSFTKRHKSRFVRNWEFYSKNMKNRIVRNYEILQMKYFFPWRDYYLL